MGLAVLIKEYLIWHYGRALRDIVVLWKDFAWFTYNFFSIPLLLKTLFSPFLRLQEQYKRSFDVEALMGNLIVNTMMRLVGFLLRSVLIIMGVLAEVFVFIIFPVAFFSWFLLPFLLAALLITGLTLAL